VPSGTPLAVAWIQVRADDTRLQPDVAQAGKRAATQASETVRGGFREGLRQGLKDGLQEAQRAGVDTAKGFRGGVVRGLQNLSAEGVKSGQQLGEGTAKGLRESRAKVAAAGAEVGAAAGDAATKGVDRKVREGGSRLSASVKEAFKGFTALGAGFAAVEIGTFFRDAVNAASDLSEAGNKLQVLYGSATNQVVKWAQGAATALGMSTLEAENAAATFGVFAKSAGLAGGSAAQFSEKMVGLAADMASFYNTSPADAIEAIGAALRGETEPIRKYGVLIDDASTRQEALRLGIISTTKNALTPQQRVLAVQSLIMRQTSAAQGDFARTSGGLANQQRILSAQFENTKAALGAGLLPLMTALVRVLNVSIIPALTGFIGFLSAVPAPVYAAAAAFAAARVSAALFSGAIGKVAARGGAMSALRGGIGSLVSLLGVGGPWGIAFTGAALVVGHFVAQNEAANRAQAALKDTMEKTSGAITAQTAATLAQQLQQKGVSDAARQLGINFTDVTQAALGNQDAYERVTAAAKAAAQQHRNLYGATTTLLGGLDDSRSAIAANREELTKERTAAGQVSAAVKAQAAAAEGAATATAGFTEKTKVSVTAQIGHQKALHASVPAVDAVQTAYKLARQALQGWLDVISAQQDRFLGGRAATRAYKEAIDAATKSIKDNGRSLNDNTAKGRANQAALDNVSSSALGVLSAMNKNNAKGPAVRAEWESQRRKLFDVYMQFDHNSRRANDYVDKALGKIPPTVKTNVTTPGLDKAKQNIRNLATQIQALKSKSLEVRIDSHGNAILHDANVGNHASGGYITGPGGPRDDKILARLSNGEFVVNAQATSRHRELLEAVNSGRVARPQGYATGGVVRDITAHTTARMPTSLVADIIAQINPDVIMSVMGGLGTRVGNVGHGVARWAPYILRALKLIGQSASWLGTVEARMQRESGGNPNAINLWDVNALHGDPSKGLMQVIGATFRAFHVRGTSGNIYDPLANIAAGLNYAVHRYGSLAALSRPGGYDLGGLASGAGLMAKATVQPERVLSPQQTQAFERWMDRGGASELVRLHPDTVAALGGIIAAAMSRQPITLDGRVLAGYVDRGLGVTGLSMRG
jgi:hypothetical protein